jgi:hypothetical protein
VENLTRDSRKKIDNVEFLNAMLAELTPNWTPTKKRRRPMQKHCWKSSFVFQSIFSAFLSILAVGSLVNTS